jgi:hypothetical protein
MKADLGNLNTASDERLAALEQRMTNVEKRLIESTSRPCNELIFTSK